MARKAQRSAAAVKAAVWEAPQPVASPAVVLAADGGAGAVANPAAGPRKRRSLAWREEWLRLWETEPPVVAVQIAVTGPPPKVSGTAPAMLASTLLHGAAVIFLASLPAAVLPAWFAGPQPRATSAPMVLYEFQRLTLPPVLPVLRTGGSGMPLPAPAGMDGATHASPAATQRAAGRSAPPRLGSSHFDPRITIASNPPHPDNFRVTLKTQNAPPELKPPADIKLPDLISTGLAPSAAIASFSPPAPPKPDRPAREEPRMTAAKPAEPRVTPAAPPKALEPPKLAAPPAVSPSVPVVKPAAATAASSAPLLKLAAKLPELPAPHLEVLPPAPTAKNPALPATKVDTAAAQPAPTPTAQDAPRATVHSSPPPSIKQAPPMAPGHAAPGTATQRAARPDILALSVNPVPLQDVAALPAGTRAGAFTISPAGVGAGVPSGAPGAPPDAGAAGHGAGSDKSAGTAAGSGNPSAGRAGPGGAAAGRPSATPGLNASANPGVSISGAAGAAGISAGTLAPLRAEDLVYAVTPDTPKARAPRMVVSSGSWGGGGLRLYGVLHGDKIYTIYFPMPGKSWILQYCARFTTPHLDAASRVIQIHFDPPLAPPAAIEQFDFHRPAPPPGTENSTIILHGVIHADGTVSDVAALESYDAASGAAACAAFRRWKFKPARRGGAPVAVEILVGIP